MANSIPEGAQSFIAESHARHDRTLLLADCRKLMLDCAAITVLLPGYTNRPGLSHSPCVTSVTLGRMA
jgi:hypothetical protein